ncbi:MAG: DUF362 domain-containing protein [Bryobacteraceae bacterium]
MHRRCFLKSLAATPAAAFVPAADPFKPGEGVNNPLGEGQGIYPGRVAWARDARATSWDGATGFWWDDASTDQNAVNRMASATLQSLTGRKNDRQAWDALFRHFNETHGFGDAGYKPGEKIAIKINANQDRGQEWGAGRQSRPGKNGLPSPHVVLALVGQLIEFGRVPAEDILIYEVAGGRNIGAPVFDRVRKLSSGVRFLVNNPYGLSGRSTPIPDKGNPIHFSGPSMSAAYLPRQVTEAKYMINVALLRPHGMAGVTLGGKNHFGSVCFPDQGGWTPVPLHPFVLRDQAMGSYNALVDLMGHRHLGGKTMLYMLDGLYTAAHNEGNVFRFASFNDHWASSLLASQDPVALDSVGLDILAGEPRATQVRGQADNYLHEAALAAKAATAYRPNGGGARLATLGVHEHWNADRKYSRNLGRKQGIELVTSL